MSTDISQIISSTGLALERQALTTFGAAVSDTASNALSSIFNLPKAALVSSTTGVNTGIWDSTPYASALVQRGAVPYKPKMKFMFKVSFQFDSAMVAAALAWGIDLTSIQQSATFLVNHIERPKFDFEYEEVNMYNVRTHVLKAIKNRDVSFTMYDDVGNNALKLVNTYRKLLSPIARREILPSSTPSDYGFAFDESLSGNDTAFRGTLLNDKINVFSKITIHQIYVEMGSSSADAQTWVKDVDYVFINPRFTNIELDEMDYENSAINTINISMNFDTVFMSEAQQFNQQLSPNLSVGDIPSNASKGTTSAQGKSGNPFLNILVNQTSRITQTAVSNAASKLLGSSFAGQLVAGQLTRATGVLAQGVSNKLSGALYSTGQGVAIPSSPPLTDNTVPAANVPSLVK